MNHSLKRLVAKFFCVTFAGILFYLISTPAQALSPPLSSEQLEKDSDLIVESEALQSIRCLEKVESNRCSDVYRYEIPVVIRKVLKGKFKAGEKITVTFIHYDYGKSGCVGDQGPIILPGLEGLFYLRSQSEKVYNAFHWSAVKTARPGSGSLPKCR